MNSLNDDLDVEPWYKQFWPWFIMALPASAVIAGITTVVIAYKNADSLVVDDYYKEGKAINFRIARIKEAENRGYTASLE
ncbi:MAG: nitrogen fixation protein FixH, partial [Enterobacterales bacterium]|nr:nitrogen fixation protein FixH [Enterobacterales bacterium]